MSVDVSIIITSYNNQDYVGRAIRSCLKQSMNRTQYEVIVVDDASTDKSRDVIDGFGDKITAIYLEKNVGVAEASNVGIRNSLGTQIIRVDSDDYITEHAVLFMHEILDSNHDIGFVYADHYQVDEKENLLQRVNLDNLDVLYRHGAGIMFRKSYMEALGLYDKSLRNAEDYDLIRRYIKNFNGYHLRLPLYRYRQHNGNMTKDGGERLRWEEYANRKQNTK